MFYAHFVLSKKGPLARIWLAAHWDKKLTKAHVFETNIEGSVEAIIQPKVKLALRTSGHLLLGVVRIYSRKAKYLLADCNEAFVKIKMAFRPGVVDLPEENREAAVATITLPETFHDFDTTMADLNDIDVQAQFSVNQSRPEEITMREDLGNITLVGDDGFGDLGFDGGPNMIQDAHMDDTLYVKNPDSSALLLDDPTSKSHKPMDIDFNAAHDDGFGDGMADFEGPAGIDDDDDSDHEDFGGDVDPDLFGENFVGEAGGLFEEPPVPELLPSAPGVDSGQPSKEVDQTKEMFHGEETAPSLPEQTVVPDQTTLLPSEAEAFALEPIDVTSIGTERKAKRRRRLVIDDQKGIASETMKLQLSDTSDITTTLDLAPPTKKLMHWKETGGVEKLFALPGRTLCSKHLRLRFSRNQVTKPMQDEVEEEPREDMDLEQQRPDESLPEMGRDQSLAEQASLVEPQSLVEEPSIAASELSASVASERAPSLADVSSLHLPPDTSLPDQTLTHALLSEESLSPPELPDAIRLDDEDDIFNDLPPSDEDNTLVSSAHYITSQLLRNISQDEVEEEERRWGKRTLQLQYILSKHMPQQTDTTSFKTLVQRNHRKQVASKFYTFLVLKKMQAIEVNQTEPYGDILISRGPRFEMVV
ncbi:hypothetical protein CAPTEDRAFT_161206 [Capitella teleta]|uniref:Rad21/Rec8-like protein N-terminal domain-containing protein n=1 Tax=Capitella teleta TaxID=283909 RepID=R7THH1_CAPTE|nr:hypothetical protein CAPTEDRAFT_161206 [Capitella teleta]|eukprot:ELT90565.1 hypothetical protein CAPTEDRAFT_161206 [Capitella teleta]